ncbi:MAG TPA: hypothetical protein VK796_00600 [Cytophaga sp.]|jgi:hypothetical protein|nr:hypothetical protein [Cytophaga sp.]
MTIDEAVKDLFQLKEFKEAAKQSAYLRTVLSRDNKGVLKTAAKLELLIKFGYVIKVNRNKSKKQTVYKP